MTAGLATNQQRAAEAAQSFLARPNAAILGVETTSVELDAQVIEIAAVDAGGRTLVNDLFNAGQPIWPSATQVHGVTQEELNAAPSIARVEPGIRRALTGRHIGAYNAPFAMTALQWTLRKAGFPRLEQDPQGPLCIMRLFAQWEGTWVASKHEYLWHTAERALEMAELRPGREKGAMGHARTALMLLRFMASHARG